MSHDQHSNMKAFNLSWFEASTAWIDCETTGTRPGKDETVQVAIARFDSGVCSGSFASLVNPGIAIPEEATKIHGITEEMVKYAPRLFDVFERPEVVSLLGGAQPAAYNAPFDRHFVPPFGDDWTWPWLDALSLVRKADRYVKGVGRHKLAATCARHGINLTDAHDARADAIAAGQLFYRLGHEVFPDGYTLGQALGWQRRSEAEEWFRFNEWLSRQPPRQAAEGVAP